MKVTIAEDARVLDVAPEYGAHVVHFNQHNFYEYFEKMNRYTETYHTGYRNPSHPTDMFEFARAQIARAEAAVKNHSGTLFDGAWELAAAMYYVCEYLKQWERSQAVDLDRQYVKIIQQEFLCDASKALDSRLSINALANKLEEYFEQRGREATFPKEVLQTMLPAAAVIVEAGSHIGNDTRELALLFPEGMVVGYEPIPNLFSRCRDNLKGIYNSRIFPYALSTGEGMVEIFVSSGASDASSSLMKPAAHLTHHPDVAFKEKIRVRTVNLYEHLLSIGVKHVDFLWLGLQGMELPVLQTIAPLLCSTRGLWLECSLVETYEGAASLDIVENWLGAFGFHRAYSQLPWNDAGNVLFLNERYFEP